MVLGDGASGGRLGHEVVILMNGISALIKEAKELMLLKYGAGEDSCESLGLQGDQTNQS